MSAPSYRDRQALLTQLLREVEFARQVHESSEAGQAMKRNAAIDGAMQRDRAHKEVEASAQQVCRDTPSPAANAPSGEGGSCDMINQPPHYTKGGIEAWDYIAAKCLNFFRGGAVKYITRAGHKPGETEEEAILKAIAMLKRDLVEVRKGRPA